MGEREQRTTLEESKDDPYPPTVICLDIPPSPPSPNTMRMVEGSRETHITDFMPGGPLRRDMTPTVEKISVSQYYGKVVDVTFDQSGVARCNEDNNGIPILGDTAGVGTTTINTPDNKNTQKTPEIFVPAAPPIDRDRKLPLCMATMQSTWYRND